MTNEHEPTHRPPAPLVRLLAMPPFRPTGGIQVFVIDGGKAKPEIARLEGLLDEDEKARAAAFPTADLARRFITGRAALRMILTTFSGASPSATAWRFGSSVLGKPHILEPGDGPPSFNMSYGDPFIAVAVSPQKNIGVDIEVEHAIPKDEIPWHLFSDHEQRQLTLSFTENFPHAFFRLWTLKEAIAKRTGQGFATEFSEIDTTGLAIIDGMDRIDELTAKGDVLVHTALVLEDKAVHLAVSSG